MRSATVPAKSLRRFGRNADHHPANGERCSLSARMRSVTLTPPSKPDGHSRPLRAARRTRAEQALKSRPLRKARRTRTSAATLAGGARPRSERTPSYPADVFPLRRAEEATTLAKGTEMSDDGRQQSSTAVRRADGLATSAALGTLFSNQNQYSARANPNATRRCFDKPTAPSGFRLSPE